MNRENSRTFSRKDKTLNFLNAKCKIGRNLRGTFFPTTITSLHPRDSSLPSSIFQFCIGFVQRDARSESLFALDIDGSCSEVNLSKEGTYLVLHRRRSPFF